MLKKNKKQFGFKNTELIQAMYPYFLEKYFYIKTLYLGFMKVYFLKRICYKNILQNIGTFIR